MSKGKYLEAGGKTHRFKLIIFILFFGQHYNLENCGTGSLITDALLPPGVLRFESKSSLV